MANIILGGFMILSIDKLKKEYGKDDNYQKVLDNISIDFKSGEFVCILGESGSGKSTLLNIIGGLDSDYSGTVNINNLNLKYIDLDDYRRERIGFIFQNFNLIPSLSIIDNIIVPLDKYNLSYKEKKRRALNLLRKLNIFDIKNKKINELSGGQKQRIAIARALINDPDIILADEPTGALDEKNSLNILEILKEIRERGKLVIVVTHSLKVIDYSTRVIRIKDGKIDSDKKIKRVKETNLNRDELESNNFLYLIKYGLRNVFNNKKRNIFITLASSIGIIGIILSLFIGNSVKNYISDLIVDKVDPLKYSILYKEQDMYSSNSFDKDIISKIKKIKHVDNIYEEIDYSISSINYNENNYDLAYLDSFDSINLEKGNDKGLVISKYLYDKLGKNSINKQVLLSLVDSYKVIEFKVKITGVAENNGISLIDNNNHAYLSYNNLKEIYKKEDVELIPNSLIIKIDDNEYIDDIKDDLEKIDLTCFNNSDLYDELSNYLNIAVFVLSMFSSLSLIVSIIMISIIINITVLERTKEIGLLRSIGYSKKNIRDIFNSEAIFLGLFIGLFSIIISKIIIKSASKIILNKFNVVFKSNNIKFYLFGLILSIILLLLASYIPSKKASNRDPINSLRYE